MNENLTLYMSSFFEYSGSLLENIGSPEWINRLIQSPVSVIVGILALFALFLWTFGSIKNTFDARRRLNHLNKALSVDDSYELDSLMTQLSEGLDPKETNLPGSTKEIPEVEETIKSKFTIAPAAAPLMLQIEDIIIPEEVKNIELTQEEALPNQADKKTEPDSSSVENVSSDSLNRGTDEQESERETETSEKTTETLLLVDEFITSSEIELSSEENTEMESSKKVEPLILSLDQLIDEFPERIPDKNSVHQESMEMLEVAAKDSPTSPLGLDPSIPEATATPPLKNPSHPKAQRLIRRLETFQKNVEKTFGITSPKTTETDLPSATILKPEIKPSQTPEPKGGLSPTTTLEKLETFLFTSRKNN